MKPLFDSLYQRRPHSLRWQRSLGMAFAFALVITMTILLPDAEQPVQSQTRSPDEFRPVRLLKEFPAITDVAVLEADDVEDQVVDGELVIGVVVNGQARAYPINMLTGPEREIINDTLGNQAIAATW